MKNEKAKAGKIAVKDLPFKIWSPAVTNVSLYNSATMWPPHKKGDRTPNRPVYQYELQVFTKTGGVAVIDGSEYPVTRGDIRFHRPGQMVSTIMDYECYSCRFIFEWHEPKTFQPLFRSEYLDPVPGFLSAALPDDYYIVFEEMIDLYINPAPHAPLLLKAGMMKLLGYLYADSIRQQHDKGQLSRNAADAVAEAIAFMKANFAEKLTLDMISRAASLSLTYFHRVFTETMSMTPLEYLTKIRIEKARTLLITTSMPVTEVAAACGFEGSSYFTVVFGRKTGQTPVRFRKHKQNENLRHQMP